MENKVSVNVIHALLGVEDTFTSSAELGRLAKVYITNRNYDLTIHYRSGKITINLYLICDDTQHPVTKQFEGDDEVLVLFDIIEWLLV